MITKRKRKDTKQVSLHSLQDPSLIIEKLISKKKKIPARLAVASMFRCDCHTNYVTAYDSELRFINGQMHDMILLHKNRSCIHNNICVCCRLFHRCLFSFFTTLTIGNESKSERLYHFLWNDFGRRDCAIEADAYLGFFFFREDILHHAIHIQLFLFLSYGMKVWATKHFRRNEN